MKEYKYKEVKDQVRMQIIGLAKGIHLRAVAGNGGWTWSLVHVTARGTANEYPLPDIGEPGDVKSQIPPEARNSPVVRAVLLALPSLARRPSDYGTSREELEDLRNAGKSFGIVQLLPLGRRIGKSKVQLSEEERERIGDLLTSWRTLIFAVKALTAPPEDTRVVSVRIPADVHHRLQSEAAATLMSPGQFVAHLLRERYKEDRI